MISVFPHSFVAMYVVTCGEKQIGLNSSRRRFAVPAGAAPMSLQVPIREDSPAAWSLGFNRFDAG